MPESILERQLRAIGRSNFRFILLMMSIFMLGHLHEVTAKEDPMTFWIISGIWAIIVFTASQLLSWVLTPMHDLTTTREK